MEGLVTIHSYLIGRGVDLSSSEHELRRYDDWVLWGLADFLCVRCNDIQILVANAIFPKFPGDVGVLCVTCERATVSFNLGMRDQHLISDRFQRANDFGFENMAKAMKVFLSINADLGFVPSSSGKDSRNIGENNNASQIGVPIPAGFRSVAWIRQYEAEAIASAYDSFRTIMLRDETGSLTFEAEYFAEGQPEVLKFRSNVKATRYRPSGSRVIGWIRKEEASAILDSYREARDVGFDHVSEGLGGVVQYFEPDSEAAKQYLSCTRLLRRV